MELWDITNQGNGVFLERNFIQSSTQGPPSAGPRPAAQQQTMYSAETSANVMSQNSYPFQTMFTAQQPAGVQTAFMQQMQMQQQLQLQQQQLMYQQQQQQAMMRQAAQQQQRQQQMAAYQQSQYGRTSAGLPVNRSGGVVATEARSVFVQGLNFKAREPDVEAYFRKAGKVISCTILTDNHTGKSKGSAKVEYGSQQEAQLAISGLNGTTFMGRTIQVRFDKDVTAIHPPPTIANGSGPNGP